MILEKYEHITLTNAIKLYLEMRPLHEIKTFDKEMMESLLMDFYKQVYIKDFEAIPEHVFVPGDYHYKWALHVFSNKMLNNASTNDEQRGRYISIMQKTNLMAFDQLEESVFKL